MTWGSREVSIILRFLIEACRSEFNESRIDLKKRPAMMPEFFVKHQNELIMDGRFSPNVNYADIHGCGGKRGDKSVSSTTYSVKSACYDHAENQSNPQREA